MKKKTEIKRIKGFLENNHAVSADFSEPYLFNCPPDVKLGFYLEKINNADNTLSFHGRSWENESETTCVTENEIGNEELTGIRRFISDNRNYIERNATFTKDE